MKIQFICRGNIFRSFIAETYLRSLNLEDVETYSTGTVAAKYKSHNEANHQIVRDVIHERGLSQFAKDAYAEQLTQEKLNQANINIFVNKPAYEEAKGIVDIGAQGAIVWNVEDFDEGTHPNATPEDIKQFVSDTFDYIVAQVDQLVRDQGLVN